MFDSLIRDIKYYYRMGDSLIKLLYVLIGSFLVLLILGAFTPKGSDFMFVLYSYLKLPSSFSEFIIKPWTLITHVFVFSSVWGFRYPPLKTHQAAFGWLFLCADTMMSQ